MRITIVSFMVSCRADTVITANTYLGDKLICSATDQLIASYEPPSEGE